MVGGAYIPAEQTDYGHAVQWIGSTSVKGPKWGKLPLLTIGMLGIQCVWSIEMGYASPFLLELGLSKSYMSLVFMAGPLSGLIVQPLVGVFADRSRSRWGRRRPFMIAGCILCAWAMMLLGYSRTVAGWLGGGDGMAIGFAVWAIYCIDFSINAVMSTDRALVVDTLPPAQQEEGSAWGGRMFGFGSVLGFFVGNLDLTGVLSFLGDTQIKILSFLTSATLLITHALTSWAVSERVLLRDERPHSRSNFISNVRAIWENMYTLPPGIQAVCIIQFFNFLAWFPILFFTSVWVSEIYKASIPAGDDPKAFEADAVRAGNRALFMQALVTITVGIGAPFLVAESGVQSQHSLGTPVRKFMTRGWATGVKEVFSGRVPIEGFTLVKLWSGSMALFSFAMLCTWFTSSVGGAYFVIALTGVGWALTNWAPYSLLGELILLDGQIDRHVPLATVESSTPEAERYSLDIVSPTPHLKSNSTIVDAFSPALSSPGSPPGAGGSSRLPSRARLPTPLRLNLRRESEEEHDSLVLHHAAEPDASPRRSPSTPLRHNRCASAAGLGSGDASAHGAAGAGAGEPSTAEKAGIILGIHNVYVVLPQFVVTALASVIFHVMEAPRTIPGSHPHAGPVGNSTAGVELGHGPGPAVTGLEAMLGRRQEGAEGAEGSPDAVGLIFRIGGVSAAVGAVLCWRLARRWERGEGI